MEKNNMVLSDAKNGDTLTIVCFEGGRKLNQKLVSMGIYKGSQLTVVSNQGQGPMVISVLDSRLALGRGIASKITVNSQNS